MHIVEANTMKIKDTIKQKNFFIQISVITGLGIILATTLVALYVLRISEKVYLDAYKVSNEKIMNQVFNEYYLLHNDIVTTLTTAQNSRSLQEYFTKDEMTSIEESQIIYKMKKQLMEDNLLYGDIPSNIVLVGLNQRTFFPGNGIGLKSADDILNSSMVKKAMETPEMITFYHMKDGFSENLKNKHVVVAIKVLRDYQSKEPYGVAMVMVQQTDFASFYNQVIDASINSVFVVDQYHTILSSNDRNTLHQSDLPLMKSIFESRDETQYMQRIQLDGYSVYVRSMPFMDMYLVSAIHEAALIKQINIAIPVAIVAILLSAFVISIIVMILRKYFKPLYTIMDHVPAITRGEFEHHIELQGSGEILELSEAFNIMLDGLNTYVDNIVKLEAEKKKTEIHALQMQINPHFMYNTLTSIKFLVWQKQFDQAIEAIDSFIHLLRNTLGNSDEYIQVKDEIANIQNYVKIQNIRYNHKITVDYYVDESCENLWMVKMLIQPFVENAFFHAFHEQDNGTLKIYVKNINEVLYIEIIDSGKGMAYEQIEQMLQGTKKNHAFSGIGIKNVNDRIKLLYSDTYGISISSIINKGTIITIRLPIVKET